MKHIGTIILMMLMTVMPMKSWAAHGSEAGGELDIPEIVLEHLADSYEWHIATYKGKHISIPLPMLSITLQTLFVMLAGMTLPRREAGLALLCLPM